MKHPFKTYQIHENMRLNGILLIQFICMLYSSALEGQCNFTISDDTPCGLTDVDFNVVSPSGSYEWDFDTDGNIDAFGSSGTFSYPQAGVDTDYTVTLYRNGSPCPTQQVTVLATPDPSIGVMPGSGIMDGNEIRVCGSNQNINLEIYNASTTYSINDTYVIDWGDGQVITYNNTTFPNTSTITHSYSGFGFYDITVTVTAANGCENVANYTLYNGGNPSVGLANPGNTTGLCAPAIINFPITNTTNNPTGTMYYVYVSGELVDSFTQETVPLVYSYTFTETSCGLITSTGNYQNAFDVQIEASNPCGSSLATIEPIEISTPPSVIFETDEPAYSCTGEAFTFTNSSSGATAVISGNPSTCSSLSPSWSITPGVPGVHWNVVSGNLFNSEEIVVEFLIPGDYTITMFINSPSCGSGQFSQNISIIEGVITTVDVDLNTAASPSSDDCAPTVATFTNGSTGDSLSYNWSVNPPNGWEFVDPYGFDTEDIQILITEAGEYEVILTVSNHCGSEIWDTLLVIADDPEIILDPIPDFCEEATLDFSASNVNFQANFGTFSSIEWDFPGATPSSSTDTYPTGIYYDSPGDYTVSVTATNQCGSFTTSQSFTIQAPGVVSIDDDVEVCVDAENFTVNANPPGGTWSGDGVNSSGVFNPSQNNIGTNLLTYTVGEGACTMVATMVVTVHPLPMVDAGDDQEACINDGTFLIDGGAPDGGTWSVNNGGVIIGNDTFDPGASGAGTYTLTYTYTDEYGCTNDATKTITVNDLPQVEAGPNQSICENPNNYQLTGFTPPGGTWSGTGVTSTGVFNASNTPGTGAYTLYYSYTHPGTGCSNLDSMIMTVVSNEVADAGGDEIVCINDIPFEITTGTPIGGTWSGNGVNSTNNIFYPLVAGVGNHVLTYTYGTGICETTDTKTITVLALPNINIPPDQEICINVPSFNLGSATPSGGTWTGNGVSGSTFLPGAAGLGTHVLTYSYTDPFTNCSDSEEMVIEVFPLPVLSSNDTSYCNTPGYVNLPDATPFGGTWSGPGVSGTQFNPALAGGTGTYVLTYSYTDGNGCEDEITINATVVDPSSIEAGDDQVLCIDAGPVDLNLLASPPGGTWSGPGLSGSTFLPALAGPGNHVMTYSIGSGNCQVSDDLTITVNPLPLVATEPDFEICVDETAITLSASPAGGSWTSNNGGMLSGSVFNPNASGSGVYSFTYTFTNNNGCTNEDELVVTVNPLPQPVSSDTSYCNTPGYVNLPVATPFGGTWSGPGVNGNQFNPVNAGGVGTYILTYQYTNGNGCSNTVNINVSVIDPDNVDAGNNFSACVNAAPIDLGQMASPPGGTWSANGSPGLSGNMFSPAVAGVGTHTLTYTIGSGNCQVSDNVVITINPLPAVDAGNDFEVCVSENAVILNGTPSGGSWTSNNGGVLGGNIFNASASGTGVFSFTYTYTNANGCTNADDILITVNGLPVLTANDTSYCNTPGLTDLPYATPAGGTWSGPGVSNNQFDPSVAGGVGNYTLTYTYTDNNGCTNSTTANISVIEPDAVDAGEDMIVCVDAQPFDLNTFATPLGGSWSGNGNPGLSGSMFNPAIAGVGTHTLTYSIGSGNCEVHDDLIVTVQALPEVDAGQDAEVCFGEPSFDLNTNTPAGGTWSGTGIIDAQNGTFDPSLAPGNYTLTYTYSDAIGCTNSDELVVTILPLPVVNAGNDTIFCAQGINVQLTQGFPSGGTWSGPGIIDAVAGTFNPDFAGGTGSYDLVYTYTNPNTGCTNFDSLIVYLIEPEVIDAGPNDTLCMDQGIYYLNGNSPTSGTWSGPGIIDPVAGTFDPEVAGGGLHVLTYSYGVGSCQVQDSRTILVVDMTHVVAGPNESTCLTYDNIILDGYSPAGGTWSGPGIIDPVYGVFDPSVAGAGTHTLTYTVVNQMSGCINAPTKIITVFPMQDPNFNIPEMACRNDVIYFDNLVTDNFEYSWDFGDGTTSNVYEPQHIYDVAGTYTVSLYIENQYGCFGSIEKEIVITDVPVAYFQPNTTEECEGLELHLTNGSFGAGMTYLWDFGNGITSTEANPDIVYYGQGIGDTTYIITLSVSNICGNSIYQDIITIHPLPQAAIGLSPENDCSPVVMNFANISTGAATNFYWDFGNGHTSNSPIPESQVYYTDSTTSVYTVTLISSNSCGVDTATTQVVVEPANVHSLFGVSGLQGCEPFTVDFYNYATPGAVIDWNFGDGNTSAEAEPTHTFENPGTYTVIQYANSECGYDSSTINIVVLPMPEVAFSHPSYACRNQPIVFTNLSVNVTGNHWDFGDGTTSTMTSPSHVFNEPGVYEVTLTGLSIFNQCPATYTSTVIVHDLPVASFEPESTYGCAPFPLQLNNFSIGGTFFEWDFGDGNTSNETNPVHVFSQPGTYEVSLVATDVNGCYNDTSVMNIIVHPSPNAAFDFERESLCGLPAEINFQNGSSGASGYVWIFGNETFSNYNNPTNIYENAGDYNVILIASNQFGCLDTTGTEIRIYPEPEADFSIGDAEGCSPVDVRFVNQSSQSNLYYWDFGDGTTSNDASPEHVYTQPGVYDVQLVVSIEGACHDTIMKENIVTVHEIPFANFIPMEVGAESDGTYEMINLSENAVEYYWEFSDGGSSTEENPIHRFYGDAVQQIYLEARSEYGCIDDTLITFRPEFIKGLFLPNGFSPEQGIGDVRVFRPRGVGLKEYHVQVFSTYGLLLWESTMLEEGQPAESWDGTYRGQLMPQDVYVWKCKGVFKDGTTWKGEKSEKGGYKTIGSVILLR